MEQNVLRAKELARAAASEGAGFIALPEYFFYYGAEKRWAEAAALSGRVLEEFSSMAGELSVYILAGSVLLPGREEGKLANTSVLFGPDGSWLARYVKNHLFDVSLDTGRFCESQWLEKGRKTAMADVAGWNVGLSICFDVRFPDHFQKMAKRGADIIAIPSAFSMETGSAHWMALIRARAIETQCYVVAPALWGDCGEGKSCFGSTAIIGPWGEPLGLLERGEGYVTAPLGPGVLRRVRQKIPMFPRRPGR